MICEKFVRQEKTEPGGNKSISGGLWCQFFYNFTRKTSNAEIKNFLIEEMIRRARK